jgi:diacylglycerol kinase (ATP)
MENKPFRQTPGSKAGYRPLRKLRTALSGLVQAIVLDFSVQYKLIVSIVFLILAAWYESPFHFVFVINVSGLMLIAEIFNTAIEELCDYVQPNYDPRIGRIKDMAAAAVTISVAIWLGMLAYVAYELLARGP